MIGTPGGTADRPATFFASADEFRAWLEAHHDTATELWMGLSKKHVADRGLTWDEAVPEALCFGCTVNIAHVERLVAEGRMRPAGLAAYEKRRPERSGIYAYESGQALTDEQRTRLLADPAAAAFWEVATPSYRRVAENWVATAKREGTRESRLGQLIDDSASGRLIKPQRYGDEPKWLAKAAAAARGAQP